MFWFIVWTWFYDKKWFIEKEIETPYGKAEVLIWEIESKKVVILPRHWKNHKNLPHHINQKANIYALKSLQVDKIISFSVCWVLNKNISLAKALIFDDLFFPDNRLWDSQICSFFDKPWKDGRWHLIASSFFDSDMIKDIKDILKNNYEENLTYVHSVWPRFNSKSEIRFFQSIKADAISQTVGPEVILSNELEIPYSFVWFWVDYANGVSSKPTTMDELNENLWKSKQVFEDIIKEMTKKDKTYKFKWFVYKFN